MKVVNLIIYLRCGAKGNEYVLSVRERVDFVGGMEVVRIGKFRGRHLAEEGDSFNTYIFMVKVP